MFCSECGNPLSEGQRFCSKCGTPVNTEDQVSAFNTQNFNKHNTASPSKNNSNRLLIILISILALLLAVVLGLLIYNFAKGSFSRNKDSFSVHGRNNNDKEDDEDSIDINDARSLAKLIDAGYAEDSCITISGRGDMSGHAASSDIDSDFDIYLIYDQKVFPSGEADEETELHIAAGNTHQITGNKHFSVSVEDGTPVTYFLYHTDIGWQRTDGDLLRDLRTYSDVFRQIAKGDIEAEYRESGDDTYCLSFTLTGDALRSFLQQYANLFADNSGIPSSADWDNISAAIELEAYCSSERCPDSMEIKLESPDLADALFDASNQFDEISDTALALSITACRYDDGDLEYELPEDARNAEIADAVNRADISEMFADIITVMQGNLFGTSSDFEDSSSAENGNAKYTSIEELLNDPDEYEYYMEIARQLDNVDDRTFDVYADGNELVIHITYPDFGPNFKEDEFSEYLWDAMQDGVTYFSLEAMDIAEKVDIEKPYLRIIMDMPDGYELFNFAYAGGI